MTCYYRNADPKTCGAQPLGSSLNISHSVKLHGKPVGCSVFPAGTSHMPTKVVHCCTSLLHLFAHLLVNKETESIKYL